MNNEQMQMQPGQNVNSLGSASLSGEHSKTCPQCSGAVEPQELAQSLWGLCRKCENGRLSV